MAQENVCFAPSTRRSKCLAVNNKTKKSFSSISKSNPLTQAERVIVGDSDFDTRPSNSGNVNNATMANHSGNRNL